MDYNLFDPYESRLQREKTEIKARSNGGNSKDLNSIIIDLSNLFLKKLIIIRFN